MKRAARRIMMTLDAVGGVWAYATMLARALARRGDHVTLVTLGPPPHADQRATLGGQDRTDLIETDLALEWLDPAGHDQHRAADTLLALAHELRPDIVHLNGFREGALVWPAPVLVVAHSCVMSWWKACHGLLPCEPRWRAYAQAVDHGLRAADAWVAPSAAFAAAMTEIYAPGTPGIVIHNGIEDVAAPPCAKRDVILASGRVWDPAKNLEALLVAAPRVDWPVEIAGPMVGPGGELAIGGSNVALSGTLARARLLERMQGAAIYAAPARYEPFGLGVLEAAWAGCALVLSDIPTFRELWNGAALFVDPDDRVALTGALNQLCGDRDLRAAFARAAAKRARCYAIETAAARYSGVYDAMLGRSASRTSRREARA